MMCFLFRSNKKLSVTTAIIFSILVVRTASASQMRQECLASAVMQVISATSEIAVSGYLKVLDDLNPKSAHTIDHLRERLTEDLGSETLKSISSHCPKFKIFVEGHFDAELTIKEGGISLGKQIYKAGKSFDIYEARDNHGRSFYAILRVGGLDRLIHVQSLLKLADVPAEQVETIGEIPNIKNYFLSSFEKMGGPPDVLFYGFANSNLLSMLRANPVSNLRNYARLSLHEFERKKSNGTYIHILELKNGKKVWIMRGQWGDSAGALFEAAAEFGVKRIVFSGTGGSLDPFDHVGDIVTPRFIQTLDGSSESAQFIPLKGAKIQGTYSRVPTPNLETREWLNDANKKKVSYVDVELGYLADVKRKYPDIQVQASLVVSDILQGPQHSDLTLWGARERSAAGKKIGESLKDVLCAENSRALQIRDYEINRVSFNDDLLISHLAKPVASFYREMSKTADIDEILTAPVTDNLIHSLMQLTPRERLKLLVWTDHYQPKNKDLETIVKLSLYDKQAWQGLLNDLMGRGRFTTAVFETFVPLMEKMPGELLPNVYRQLQSLYPHATKMKFSLGTPPARKPVASKRLLDALIFHIINPAKLMEELNLRGIRPIDAYQRYIEKEQLVVSDSKVDSYSAHDVLLVGRIIRDVLRSATPLHDSPLPEITISGSFPSGHASISSSDLDVIIPDHRLEQYYGKIREKIDQALAPRFGRVNLELHSMRDGAKLTYAAAVNPVFLHVTTQKVEILAYPSFRRQHNDPKFERTGYPAPLILDLEDGIN